MILKSPFQPKPCSDCSKNIKKNPYKNKLRAEVVDEHLFCTGKTDFKSIIPLFFLLILNSCVCAAYINVVDA